MSGSTKRAERTGSMRSARLALVNGDKPGDAALDRLLEDDVGLVQAVLRPGLGQVFDLDGQGGALGTLPAGAGVWVSGHRGTGRAVVVVGATVVVSASTAEGRRHASNGRSR